MYIVLEGIVGSGKSTQVRRLVKYLRSYTSPPEKGELEGVTQKGIQNNETPPNLPLSRERWKHQEVIHVREPGSTPIAEDIRHLAQAKEWEGESMHPLTNAYLYAAARSQTLHTIVKPALDAGKTVISDRCFLSSCAYQGEAQWLGIDTILAVNEEAICGIFPDIVLYMDIDIETALSRTSDTLWDKWEKMDKGFFEAIVRGYDKCEKLDIMKNRFVRIDANGSEEEIFERILKEIYIRKTNL
jgi:dTMP kinase